MDELLKLLHERFDSEIDVAEADIRKAELRIGLELPEDCRSLIHEVNGIEGAFGESAYVVIWPLEDVVDLNEAYAVDEFAPGLFLVGSDGGNTGYAFDTRQVPPRVVSVPLVGMSLTEVAECAGSFETFLRALLCS